MADIIKTDYMDRATVGYSSYIVLNAAALAALSPKPGDRAVVTTEGKVYFCVNKGEWKCFGGGD